MQKKKIVFYKEAREKILSGVEILSKAVEATLGPRSGNVIDYNENGGATSTNDGVTVASFIKIEDKLEEAGARVLRDIAVRTNNDVGDGPQDLDSKILTPHGWVRMGDIKVGMEICGTNGTIQKVLGVYPKGKKEIYKVKFFDDREVKCCKNHLWKIITAYGAEKIATTEWLINSNKISKENKNGDIRHGYYVPSTHVEFKNNEELPLDPYLLGLLLGDGSLSGTGSIELSLGIKKEHVIDKIVLPKGMELNVKFVKHKNSFRVKIRGKNENNLSIFNIIESLGLLGVVSSTKFIPKKYLYSSSKVRKKLLQGLLDTDGYINDRGLFEYSTTSKRLSKDILELVRGLGKSAGVWKLVRTPGSSYSNTPIYRIQERRGFKYGTQLVSIEPTGKIAEMQCIKVSNPDNLYITDDYIVTHNTTSSVAIAHSLIKEGMPLVESGIKSLMMKEGIDQACKDITQELENSAIQIETSEQIRQIAAISSQNNEMAEVIADVFDKVGNNATITIEDSYNTGYSSNIIEGYEINNGFFTESLINTDRAKCILEEENGKIPVLITDYNIINEQDIIPLLAVLKKNDISKLCIIANNFDGIALASLIYNHKVKKFESCLIKAPEYQENKNNILEDIAVMTGGTVISPRNGKKLSSMTLDDLGYIKRVESSNNSTILVGTMGNKDLINERIEKIKGQQQVALSEYEQEHFGKRIAKMTTGITVIYVGQKTEFERTNKKLKMEDAVKASKAAIEEGVIPGGGAMLAKIAKKLRKNKTGDREFDTGYQLLLNAIEYPLKKICENAGSKSEIVLHAVQTGDFNYGYDARKMEYCDVIERGIIDPVKVTKNAVQNAASAAGLLLTTDVLVATYPDESVYNPYA